MAYKDYYEYKDIVEATGKSYSAIKKCPLIKIYNPDYDMYNTKSDAFFKLLSKYSYCVQKASIDEGYIEVTGIIKGITIEELKKNSIIYAETLQNDIKNTLGFTINIRYKQF